MNNYLVNKMTEQQARMVAAVMKYDDVVISVDDKKPLEIRFDFTSISTFPLYGPATFVYDPQRDWYTIYWDGTVCDGSGVSVDYVLDNFVKLSVVYRIKKIYEHDMKILGMIPLDGGD